MKGWFIAHTKNAALILHARDYHVTQLRAMGVQYVTSGYRTRKAARRAASYLGYGHTYSGLALYSVKNGQSIL